MSLHGVASGFDFTGITEKAKPINKRVESTHTIDEIMPRENSSPVKRPLK